ncbi:tetratricopeptide repeat protein [Roseixanthobacter glucoisosaccharinicivorans]|uniref:tetratricopeptide repeat protein n=1 Tax=Roseixanthobacter glucoisosaccharinicivorans TaxID=3119923 RepID=UPI0037296AA0
MRGRIDGMSGEVLRAWAWDPDRPEFRVPVRLVIDDTASETLIADAPRQDLRSSGIGDGAHGVRFVVPLRLFNNSTRWVSLRTTNEQGLDVELDRREITLAQRAHVLDGRVENLRRGRCRGWIWCPSEPDLRIAVEALWKGAVVGTAVADRPRRDLLAAGVGDGAHGFEIPIPGSVWQFPDDDFLKVVTTDGYLLGSVQLPTNQVLKSLVDLGRQAERDGDQRSAIKNLDEALRLSPDNVDALWVRARIAAGQGDTEKARQLARQAFELHPSHARAVVILGRLAYTEGNYEEALDFWRQVKPTDSAYRESLIKSGRSFQRLERYVEMLSPARTAVALNPDDADAHQLLAEAYLAIGSAPLAMRHFKQLEKIKPGDKKAATQLQKLSAQQAFRDPPVPLEIIENPTLKTWDGPAEGRVSAPTEITTGVLLGPADRRGAVHFLVMEPQEFRAGNLPHYGLRVTADRTPAELAFRMRADAAENLADGIKLSAEVRSIGQAAPIDILLVLRVPGRPETRRLLLSLEATKRAKLKSFDCILSGTELASLKSGDAWLVLRVAANCTAVLRAPRPMLKIVSRKIDLMEGPEGPRLDAFEMVRLMRHTELQDTNGGENEMPVTALGEIVE